MTTMVEQTPLEQLQAMNEQVGKTRRRKAKPRDPTDKIERYYRAQITSLVRAMAKEVKEEIVPIVREEKQDYRVTSDSVPTMDGWSERIINALNALLEKYTGPRSLFQSQYERLAQSTVSMADAESTQAFVKSVNNAVGVDLNPMLDQDGMQDYINAATWSNLQLIKSVPEEYFKRIENAVMGGVRGGDAPSRITDKIQEATGVSRRRAQLIARDQSAKLTGEITERRQKQAGVKYFRWVTSKDQRVGDDHRRAANRDVGYGPGVYRWDDPPKEGVPGNATRPNCRCTATPVFDFELPKDKQK